jgi:hypothetical protein
MQLRRNASRVYQPLLLLVLFGLLVLGACQSETPTPTPTAEPTATSEAIATSPLSASESPLSASESPLAAPREIAAGKSVVIGRLFSTVDGQPLKREVVRLAEIYCPEGTAEDKKSAECVWGLDNAFSPTAFTDENGYFEFPEVEARDYALMVGDYIGKYAFLNDEDDRPIILTAPDGEVLDIGEHALDY